MNKLQRFRDVLVSSLLLICLFPLILVIGFISYKLHGRPVLFSQQRIGLHRRKFRLHKFRTMRQDNAQNGVALSDEQRLTAFGRWMRATSLDELPSLWNVLTGDMSLVGPRPLLTDYLPLYTRRQSRRHEVKPGVTGWAQINGRNTLSWEKKFDMDVWYVEHQSIGLDLKILLLTVWCVLRREGITPDGHATMQRFEGSTKKTDQANSTP